VRKHRFELGQLLATPGALEVLGELEVSPSELLARHASGDWGAVPAEDARENALSVREGFRIVSSYPLGEEARKVWVITESDRSSTCILLPEEY
jgi:hypothetical protein